MSRNLSLIVLAFTSMSHAHSLPQFSTNAPAIIILAYTARLPKQVPPPSKIWPLPHYRRLNSTAAPKALPNASPITPTDTAPLVDDGFALLVVVAAESVPLAFLLGPVYASALTFVPLLQGPD